MNRMLKILISLCCLVVIAAGLGSCATEDLPEDETLRLDFENYLNYYGELPFTYNFKTFEVTDRVKNKDNTGIATIEASVERLYDGETYSDITYEADIHYSYFNDEWNHEYVIVKSSTVSKGFDMESIFLNTFWVYDEEASSTKEDLLEDKNIPYSLDFNTIWDKDTLPVFLTYSEEDEVDASATFRGMEAYVEVYGDIEAWDFRIVYVLNSGAVIDFVHVSGSIFDVENWLIGYRESTTKERSLVFYKLESVED